MEHMADGEESLKRVCRRTAGVAQRSSKRRRHEHTGNGRTDHRHIRVPNPPAVDCHRPEIDTLGDNKRDLGEILAATDAEERVINNLDLTVRPTKGHEQSGSKAVDRKEALSHEFRVLEHGRAHGDGVHRITANHGESVRSIHLRTTKVMAVRSAMRRMK